ncbi:MAG: hypothetical protein WCL54_06005 [Clostridia bacterium]
MKLQKVIKWVLISLTSLVSLFFIIWLILKITPHMALELALSYNWDTPVYWIMGRSIMNGLLPYVDMFEIKGPGIFFITYFSFLTSGGPWVGNLINFIALLFVGLSPIGVLLSQAKKFGLKAVNFIAYPIALIAGGLLMIYTGDLAGQIQTESYGAGFACIYLMIIASLDAEKVKWNNKYLWISSLFLIMSVAMKEPFVLLCFAGALLFCTGIKQVIKLFVLPLVYAASIGSIFMLATGMFLPYVNDYILYILTKHVGRYGSIWNRAFAFDKVFDEVWKYNNLLLALILVSFILAVVFQFLFAKRNTIWYFIFNTIKFVPIAVFPVLAVAFGGEFYGHHFAFAVPVYIALVMFVLREIAVKEKIRKEKIAVFRNFIRQYALVCLLLFSFAIVYFIAPYSINSTQSACLNNNDTIRADAKRVDDLLEKMGESRYLYLGMNGPVFPGLTTHSPQGPVFMQDPRWFSGDQSEFFIKNLTTEIQNTKLVVVQISNEKAIFGTVRDYLYENFTEKPPALVANMDFPSIAAYKVYFRK